MDLNFICLPRDLSKLGMKYQSNSKIKIGVLEQKMSEPSSVQ